MDDVLDGQLVSNVSNHERLVVTASDDHERGESLKLAVRPERIRIDLAGEPAPEDGSRLEGVVSEVVYLGSLTQFHVDTKAGARRQPAHERERRPAGIELGPHVVLTWPVDDGAVLGPARSWLRLAGDAPA